MTFGAPEQDQSRVSDLKDVEAIVDTFLKHGHREIDTSRVYCGGTSEEYLGKLDWQGKGVLMETKYYPARVRRSHPLVAALSFFHPYGLA